MTCDMLLTMNGCNPNRLLSCDLKFGYDLMPLLWRAFSNDTHHIQVILGSRLEFEKGFNVGCYRRIVIVNPFVLLELSLVTWPCVTDGV